MKRPAKALHWDDERPIGNSLIVTLRHGWAFEPHESELIAEHVAGFDTVKAALSRIRFAKPCQCRRCREGDDA